MKELMVRRKSVKERETNYGREQLSTREKIGYGLGAVGKDMVYMLSASYIQYYFYDITEHENAWENGRCRRN